MITHTLQSILALGLSEVATNPTVDLPGPSLMRRVQAHRAYRLADGLWHYFRFTDVLQASKEDADFNKPMLRAIEKLTV